MARVPWTAPAPWLALLLAGGGIGGRCALDVPRLNEEQVANISALRWVANDLPRSTSRRLAGGCVKDHMVWQPACNDAGAVCAECGVCVGLTASEAQALDGSAADDAAECGGCWQLGQNPEYTCAGTTVEAACGLSCLDCLPCFGIDRESGEVLTSRGIESLANWVTESELRDCVAEELDGLEVGEPAFGCCEYAEIVAVYAPPALWQQVSAWAPAGGAVEAVTKSTCQELCVTHADDGCDVWTHKDSGDGAECWLKRGMKCNMAACNASLARYVAVSGARACGTSWRPFAPPRSDPQVAPSEPACHAAGFLYGVQASGSCADAQILEVHGPLEGVYLGARRGWWPASDAYVWQGSGSLSSEGLLEGCQQRCATNKDCFAINVFHAGQLAGLCILAREISCNPALGSWPGAAAALKLGCADPSEGSEAEPTVPIPCGANRCTEPNTAGYFFGANFVPQMPAGEDCYFHFFDHEECAQCLRDRWLVVTGGSNMFALGLLIFNFHAGEVIQSHEDYSSGGTWCCPGGADIVDVVYDSERRPVYQRSYSMGMQTTGLSPAGGWEAIRARLDLAPPSPGGFRFTLVAGNFWEQVPPAWLAVSRSAGSWAAAQKIFFVQVMQWYAACQGGYGSCPRSDLKYRPRDEVIEKYKQGLDAAFADGLDDVCSDAATRACFISTNMYGGQDQAMSLIAYNTALESKVVAKASAGGNVVKYFDIYGFTSMIASEVVQAHASPMVYLWIYQVALNSVCEDPLPQGECPAKSKIELESQCLWKGLSSQCGGGDFNCRLTVEGEVCYFTRQPVALNETGSSGDQNDEQLCPEPNLAAVLESYTSARPSPLTPPPAATSDSGSDDPCSDRLGGQWCDDALRAIPVAFGALSTLGFVAWVAWPFISKRLGFARAAGPVEGTKVTTDGVPTKLEGSQVDGAVVIGMSHVASNAVAGGAEAADGNDVSAAVAAQAAGDGGGGRQTRQDGRKVSEGAGAPATESKEWLHALGAARFVASLHIVIGHMQAKVPAKVAWASPDGWMETHLSYLFGWGFTWVPWFFMLSGYVLTHARMQRGKPKPMLQFMKERLASIYPLYVFGVLASLVIRLARGAGPMPWLGGLLQPWLLQAWLPPYAEMSIQPHCWFLSCLPLYWLAFGQLAPRVQSMGLTACLAVLVVLSLVPWVFVVFLPWALPDTQPDWSKAHTFGEPRDVWEFETPEDFWAIFLKFHPLCYFHLFFYGMTLAQLRQCMLRSERLVFRRCLMCAAEVGYLALFLIFFSKQDREDLGRWGYKLAARLSVLAPLQGMVLLGLSQSGGPLCRLFSVSFMPALGEISYAQYILQFCCWYLWPTADGSVGPGFFVFLFGCAFLCHVGIQRPCQALWRRLPWAVLAALPLCLTIVLVLASVLRDVAPQSSVASPSPSAPPAPAPPLPPTTVDYRSPDGSLNMSAPGLYDMALDLAADEPLGGLPNGTNASFINPSLAVTRTGRLVVAVRRHAQGETRGVGLCKVAACQGQMVDELRHTFYSDVVGAGASWNRDFNTTVQGLQLQRVDFRTRADTQGAEWLGLCPENGFWLEANATLVRKQVLGPEDPRVISFKGGALLSFYSMPVPGPACPDIPVPKVYVAPESVAGCPSGTEFKPGPGCLGVCPPGFTEVGTACMARGRTGNSYSAARDHCRAMASGAMLASVSSEEEQGFVDAVCTSTASPRYQDSACWIGLTKSPIGPWTWEDGTAFGKVQNWGEDSKTSMFASHTAVSINGEWYAIEGRQLPSDWSGMGSVCKVRKPKRAPEQISWGSSRLALEARCSERADKKEKNWIGFDYNGRLMWVYSVLPHVVKEARTQDGACTEVSRTTYNPLAQLSLAHPQLKIRGSGSAVPWTCGGEGCFLAALHTVDSTGKAGPVYAHFLYKFAGSPPFAVLAVAQRPLGLLESSASPYAEAFAFVGGLAVSPSGQEVIVSYGAGDRQARVLVMSPEHVEGHFSEC